MRSPILILSENRESANMSREKHAAVPQSAHVRRVKTRTRPEVNITVSSVLVH